MEVLNLVAASWLCGLIWVIQVVHYPLFAVTDAAGWSRYVGEHQRRITWIVLPMMLVNVGVAVALLLESAGPGTVSNAALAAGVFALTGLVFAPLHGDLVEDQLVAARLVRLNWVRTGMWTAQTAVAISLV